MYRVSPIKLRLTPPARKRLRYGPGSAQNLKKPPLCASENTPPLAPLSTRSRTSPSLSDWSLCLICCSKKSKNVGLLKVQTAERQRSIRQAAMDRRDMDMLGRIEAVNLVDEGAVYHNTCMSSYTSKEHIRRAQKKVADKENGEPDVYKAAFNVLVDEIEGDLTAGKAFRLKHLAERYNKLLPDHFEPYRSQLLQKRLQRHFGDRIEMHSERGQGKSTLVMSSDIKMKEAVQAFASFKENLSPGLSLQEPSENVAKDILHEAVGKLKEEIATIPKTNEYPTAADISIEASEKFVPPSLAKVLLWLLDDEAFSAADPAYQPSNTVWRRVLSLAECIIYCCRRDVTPFHLGMAAHLYHEYGKKELIDTLNSHGFVITYDELRRFITAVGEKEQKKNQDQVYIPHGLISRQDGGLLIHEGADNIDINCRTVDGKGTFHALARVVFQQQATDSSSAQVSDQKVPRGRRKSLSPTASSVRQVLRYNKATRRPDPPRIVDALRRLKNLMPAGPYHSADLSWVLMRAASRERFPSCGVDLQCDGVQHTPFWTGANSQLAEKLSVKTVAAYAPVIDAKPADPATIYSAMIRCRDMSHQMGQQHSIQTMDQQLYAVAQQVKWSHAQEFSTHILRLGGFHSLSSYISAVGRLWGDGGLKALLVDSGVYADSTATLMLAGKEFHRSVRGLTLSFEAMMQMFLLEFMKWSTSEDGTAISSTVWRQLEDTLHAARTNSKALQQRAMSELNLVIKEDVLPSILTFQEWGCTRSPTFQYWCNFLESIQIMLQNIRSEREGDWSLHLASSLGMLPYFFATNHINYARWMSVYLTEMTQLPADVEEAFQSGQFAVRRTAGAFNGIWSDMGVESTIIRDAKGTGGVVGLTRKEPALVRWMLTRHHLGQYSSAIRERSGRREPGDLCHEQTNPASMQQDEQHVAMLLTHLQNNMTHPFRPDDHPEKVLVNISTGMLATPEVQTSLLTTVDASKEQMLKFIETSLTPEGTRSLHCPIRKTTLTTFSDMIKSSRIRVHGTTIKSSISAEMVFRRALQVTQARQEVTIETVLSHPVTSIPTSLFHEDGSLRKTAKSDLIHELEDRVSTIPAATKPAHNPDHHVFIRDGMAELQSMGGHHHTFQEFAQSYLDKLLRCLGQACTAADVFDRYDVEDSIKGQERRRRQTAIGATRRYQVTGSAPIPPWQKFMAVSANKSALTEYLVSFIAERAQMAPELCGNKKIVLAGGSADPAMTMCLTSESCTDVPELRTSQEEADTRLLLQASHADKEFGLAGVRGDITILSPDTDVLVLAVHFFPKLQHIGKMWVQMGSISSTLDNRRLIPIHSLCANLDPAIPRILPALHALTGSDTTSSLFGMGKTKAFRCAEKLAKEGCLPSLDSLATSTEELAVNVARQFVARLYDPGNKYQQAQGSLNRLRVLLASKKDVQLHRLPPAESSFLQHVRRAVLQTKIWMASDVPEQLVPTPVGSGWQLCGSSLVPVLFEGTSTAELLDDLLCGCRGRQQCSKDCSCVKNKMACTEQCMCGGGNNCHNSKHDDADAD